MDRVHWSWATSVDEADRYRVEARALVGRQLGRIRYFDIDYRAEQYRRDHVGPRTIESEVEWVEPTWSHPACDSIDHAVELETSDGARFTVSWHSPGMAEGLGLRELRAIGNAVRDDADVAVWDVSDTNRWKSVRDAEVTSVEMHYQPWGDSDGHLWCPWITIELGGHAIEFVLAEGDPANNSVRPSSDNIAVIFDKASLPSWLFDRHRSRGTAVMR